MLDFLLFILGKCIFFCSSIGGDSFPKPLTSEKEAECLIKMQNGDKEARDLLIKHNLRLVAHIVKKYQGVEDSEDLISVGTIGLIKAINTFKPNKGTSLSTYTSRCIENEILMLIRANKKYKNTVSLSDAVGVDKDGNELTLIDLLFENDDEVIEKVEKSISKGRFLSILKEKLSDREYKVLVLRYGLKGNTPLAQREVASLMKISRSYISRIEKKAIEKLRCEIKKSDFY
ncbi:MAG: RNA polymerase sporulation sigma factor SigK [Clostridia bacterium]|nr:RNA polymerase sporulation sigma factor SigK [Clostridia bacterium]